MFYFFFFFPLQFVGLFNFPYHPKFSQLSQIIWSIFPPNLLAKAIWLLTNATSTPQDVGIRWSRRAICTPNDAECVITIVSSKLKACLAILLFFCYKKKRVKIFSRCCSRRSHHSFHLKEK